MKLNRRPLTLSIGRTFKCKIVVLGERITTRTGRCISTQSDHRSLIDAVSAGTEHQGLSTEIRPL
jgi:hypothetical protein